ncbi:MAG: hypothetical protein SOI26_08045 [Coriobacteriales bacterium]|jgi:coproporphyrinogen III oxidase-like Fe-S oxidoreductase
MPGQDDIEGRDGRLASKADAAAQAPSQVQVDAQVQVGARGAQDAKGAHADLVLRVEVPFCAQLALYQRPGARHTQPSPRLLDAYVDALEAETRAAGAEARDHRVIAVHVAGDCPSMLGEDRFERLMRCVRGCFALGDDAEVVVDVLPGSLSAADLLAYRRSGVTRLVADIVADTPDESVRTGRFADMANMGATMRIVRTAHAEGLVDLRMRYGLPRQTPSLWRRELSNALEWRPGQVELVPLMIEPGSRMWEEGAYAGAPAASASAAMPAVSQKVARQLADVAADVLGGAGYERVAGASAEAGTGTEAGSRAGDAGGEEVWALPGRESRLTRARTAGVETLGLGVGAASRIDGFAYENADDLDLYLAKSADISAIARGVRRVG